MAVDDRRDTVFTDRLENLTRAGVSIWLDDLSRERLTTGNLAALIRDYCVTGVTTNPTIFAAAVSAGDAYDDQIRQLARRGASVETAIREITADDVAAACDVLVPTWLATAGMDGRVSIEVDPRLAADTDGTVAEAVELWKTVDKPNLLIKVPATEEGLPAITRVLAEGISVNVTLIFSVTRYREVIRAFFSGLEHAWVNGHDLSRIQSVASFFVSRVDSEVDTRLDAIGTDTAAQLTGQAAMANARLAYAVYRDEFTAARWRALAAEGAHRQRPLWASTGVKDPTYSDTRYVDQLIAPGTVNTMPEATLHAVADHGTIVTDVVTDGERAAHDVIESLRQVGIDINDVCEQLEREGVQKFQQSWRDLTTAVRRGLDSANDVNGRPSP